jgi:streptogramin lyase
MCGVRRRRPFLGALLLVISFACDRDAGDEGSTAGRPTTPDHGTVVRIDADSLEVRSILPVGADPLILAVAGEGIWTLSFADGTLSRIDPAGNDAPVVDVGEVVGIASDGNDLWVARNGNEVARLDGATGEEESSFRLAKRPLFALRDAGFLAVGFGSVWLTVPGRGGAVSQTLRRIEAESGRTLDRISVGPDPIPPVIAEGAVWVLTTGDRSLARIDPDTDEASEVEVGPAPWGIAGGDGSVWVGHQVEPEVRRLDPGTGETTARVPLEEDVRGLAFGGGLLWVATDSGISAIDPNLDRVTATIELGHFETDTGPIGIGYLDGEVWVSIE